MENEIQIVGKNGVENVSVANGCVVNSNSVNGNIVPEELVALGFPPVIENPIADNTYFWTSWDVLTQNLYNSIYTLKKIYEKYTSKKLKLKASIEPKDKHSYTIFLDGKEVFNCHEKNRSNNHKNLQRVVDIVKELLPIVGGFENLKQEFAELYRKEKVKFELNEVEFYRRKNKYKFETEAEREEREKLIEAFKNDKELAEKVALHIKKPKFFGKRYSKEKDAFSEKLVKFLRFNGSGITSIRIYRNLLVFELFMGGLYAIKLSKAEKQRVLNIFTLLKL